MFYFLHFFGSQKVCYANQFYIKSLCSLLSMHASPSPFLLVIGISSMLRLAAGKIAWGLFFSIAGL